MHIGPDQVAVLLDPEHARVEKVTMPVLLGEWTRGQLNLWWFDLSIVGVEVAARARDLSDAATSALQRYREGDPAHCFTGAFRDGFSYGANWQRRLDDADDEPE